LERRGKGEVIEEVEEECIQGFGWKERTRLLGTPGFR
jgi:hypothetical protein